MMAKRVMGKASFVKLQDRSGQIQVRLERDRLPEGVYQAFKKWDVGDIVGAKGELFRTQTGELTVLADEVRLLTKSLRPLPEKCARPGRPGNALPAALCRPDHQRIESRGIPQALADRFLHAGFLEALDFSRSRRR